MSPTCISTLMATTIHVRIYSNPFAEDLCPYQLVLLYVFSDENIFPVWDFHELAGMTAELDTPLLSCDGKGGSDYDRWPKVMNYTKEVGGVSDSITGAAAMNLSSGTLHHVQNFWAFADDFYLHLGASP